MKLHPKEDVVMYAYAHVTRGLEEMSDLDGPENVFREALYTHFNARGKVFKKVIRDMKKFKGIQDLSVKKGVRGSQSILRGFVFCVEGEKLDTLLCDGYDFYREKCGDYRSTAGNSGVAFSKHCLQRLIERGGAGDFDEAIEIVKKVTVRAQFFMNRQISSSDGNIAFAYPTEEGLLMGHIDENGFPGSRVGQEDLYRSLHFGTTTKRIFFSTYLSFSDLTNMQTFLFEDLSIFVDKHSKFLREYGELMIYGQGGKLKHCSLSQEDFMMSMRPIFEKEADNKRFAEMVHDYREITGSRAFKETSQRSRQHWSVPRHVSGGKVRPEQELVAASKMKFKPGHREIIVR